jgi:hypothetical protein
MIDDEFIRKKKRRARSSGTFRADSDCVCDSTVLDNKRIGPMGLMVYF